MPRKILFDTDPGVDDAMALLFALQSPELEVVGVTTVYGNAEVEQTTLNALRVLEVAGRTDIPVAAGAARPLVRPYRGRRGHIHGEDGLGNTFLPPPSARPLDMTAAEFIVRAALAQRGELTLVAVGPLTNLALAVRLEPRVVAAVRQVIIMGGAAFVPGNASPVAEANIFNDPEAARIVFSAGWPLVMVGLDVTLCTVMTTEYLHHLFPSSGHPLHPLTNFVARIVPVYLQSYRDRYGMDGIPTHDPSAIAYAIDPGLFRVERLPVFVETAGRCAGQTVPDPFGGVYAVRSRSAQGRRFRQRRDPSAVLRLRSGCSSGQALPEIEVCVEVDSPRLLALFSERMQKPHPRPAATPSPEREVRRSGDAKRTGGEAVTRSRFDFQPVGATLYREQIIAVRGLVASSALTGVMWGVVAGTCLGAAMGALTLTLVGVVAGVVIGALCGAVTGPLVGAAVGRLGGTTGGVSIGAYTGMVVGAALGLVGGLSFANLAAGVALIRQTVFLDGFALGYFQASMLGAFLGSVLGTSVGAIIGGKNKAKP